MQLVLLELKAQLAPPEPRVLRARLAPLELRVPQARLVLPVQRALKVQQV